MATYKTSTILTAVKSVITTEMAAIPASTAVYIYQPTIRSEADWNTIMASIASDDPTLWVVEAGASPGFWEDTPGASIRREVPITCTAMRPWKITDEAAAISFFDMSDAVWLGLGKEANVRLGLGAGWRVGPWSRPALGVVTLAGVVCYTTQLAATVMMPVEVP